MAILDAIIFFVMNDVQLKTPYFGLFLVAKWPHDFEDLNFGENYGFYNALTVENKNSFYWGYDNLSTGWRQSWNSKHSINYAFWAF